MSPVDWAGSVTGMNLACVAGGIVWVRDLSFGGGAVFQKKGSRDEAVEIPTFSRLRRS